MLWDALSNFVLKPFDNMHLAVWNMATASLRDIFGRLKAWTEEKSHHQRFNCQHVLGCFLVLVPFNTPKPYPVKKDIHPSAHFHPVGRSDPSWILKKIIHEKKMDVIYTLSGIKW